MVCNRLKIQAAVINAQQFPEIQREFDSFAAYLWRFSGCKPILNR
jgi:DNA-3-methyladenine glycosylase I